MWTRNNNVSNWNMLKHFIYLSFSKLTTSFSKSITSLLCSLYYRYSLKLSSFFYILSFLVRAISIDQTFYSAMHYLAAVWLDSKHDFNKILKSLWSSICKDSFSMMILSLMSQFYISNSSNSFLIDFLILVANLDFLQSSQSSNYSLWMHCNDLSNFMH